MRRRISRNKKWNRYLNLVIGLVILFVIIDKTMNNAMELDTAFTLSIGIIILGLISYLINKTKTIEFDEKYMYITTSSKEEKVELKNVTRIKLTMTEVNESYMWRIDYYSKTGRFKSIKFFPSWINNNFEEFKDLVKTANKNVIIKSRTNSFDF